MKMMILAVISPATAIKEAVERLGIPPDESSSIEMLLLLLALVEEIHTTMMTTTAALLLETTTRRLTTIDLLHDIEEDPRLSVEVLRLTQRTTSCDPSFALSWQLV